MDYSKGFENVLSVQYRTSTAAYLAGYAAASVSKTGTLGQILGTEGSVILEFVVGFEQGAKAAKPDIKLLRATVNSANPFSDPAKGKELALAQIQQGADVIFPIAGGTGIGALQAARDSKVMAIGVDADQATIFSATDEAQADVIITSVEKRVGDSLYVILKQTVDGTAKYGTASTLGLQEGSTGISKNKWYDRLCPGRRPRPDRSGRSRTSSPARSRSKRPCSKAFRRPVRITGRGGEFHVRLAPSPGLRQNKQASRPT